MPRISLSALSAMDRDAFAETLGGVFEHSPWVAERAWEAKPFADVEVLHGAMTQTVRDAGHERQLALSRAHPELAGKAAAEGTLSCESTGEQAGAGLDRCTPEELVALHALNRAYRDRFDFPFVMAVKGRSRSEILAALRERLDQPVEEEFARCLNEIAAIARMRLADLIRERS